MLSIQQRLSRRFFILLSLPATAMGFALSVQISALSWILTTQYGLDIHQVGLVWAAGPIAGILGQVLIGIISDNVWLWYGRRRPFILIGGFFAALMLLALPNIDIIGSTLNIEALLGIAIAVALTLDLSINISFNPTRAIIADVTPQGEKRTQGYTWMQTVSGSFGVLAYAVGAIWGNIVLIYLGAVLVFLLSIVPPFFIKEPNNIELTDTTHNSSPNLSRVLAMIKPLWGFILYDIYAMTVQVTGIEYDHYWPEAIALVVIFLFVFEALLKSDKNADKYLGFQKVLAAHSFSWVGVQTMFVFMFAFVQFRFTTLSDDELGKFIATSFLILSVVAAILPAVVLEPLAKRFGRVKVHCFCMLSMAISYALLAAFGVTAAIVFVLMALLGVGWSSIISLPFAIMSEKVEQTRMGLFMGLFNLSVVLPQLLVSLGVGLLINKVEDKTLVFYVSAVALMISAFAWSRLIHNDSNES